MVSKTVPRCSDCERHLRNFAQGRVRRVMTGRLDCIVVVYNVGCYTVSRPDAGSTSLGLLEKLGHYPTQPALVMASRENA